jgi:hypothetical protein
VARGRILLVEQGPEPYFNAATAALVMLQNFPLVIKKIFDVKMLSDTP